MAHITQTNTQHTTTTKKRVARALEREDWRPLGAGQPHGVSAREVRRIVLESLDALFGLGLPLPAEVVAMHMEGVDGVLHRYVCVLPLAGREDVMMMAGGGLATPPSNN